jgi:hypothetical protein
VDGLGVGTARKQYHKKIIFKRKKTFRLVNKTCRTGKANKKL